jgi:hypothetical protein
MIFRVAAISTLALMVSLPALAASGDFDPASARACHDYTLSVDKINAMQAADG